MGHIRPQQQITARHGECDHIERHTDGLREVQGQTDGAANVQAKRPRNHVVSATTFDLLVGGNLRHSQRRGHGHEMAHKHDQQSGNEADVGHRVSKPQEQNRPQNGRDGRQKHRPCAHGFDVGLWHHDHKVRP